jgi:hypothetical protein
MPQQELLQWLADGRLGPQDYVWAEGMDQWARPADVPELAPAAPGPAAPVPSAAPPVQQPLRAHRGGAILALGIISIVMGCLVDLVCGIIGLNMANKDRSEIAAGRMDPAGAGLIQAGRICCIIGIILGCLRLVAAVVWLIFFAMVVSRQ